jgi:hypothetical protein
MVGSVMEEIFHAHLNGACLSTIFTGFTAISQIAWNMWIADWVGTFRIVLISKKSPICHTLPYAKYKERWTRISSEAHL